MGEKEVRDFLLHLIRDCKASPATQDMYVNAFKFLYTVTLKRPEVVKDISHPQRPQTLPVIISPTEVLNILQILLGHSSIRTTLRYTHITHRLIQKLMNPLDMIQPVS